MAINMHYKEIIMKKTIEFQLADVSREHFYGFCFRFWEKSQVTVKNYFIWKEVVNRTLNA